jgi:hypothetical protein
MRCAPRAINGSNRCHHVKPTRRSQSAGEFRSTAAWLKSPSVNGGGSGVSCARFPTNPYEKREKSAIRAGKCASKILVNRNEVARVSQKAEPEVVRARAATACRYTAPRNFPLKTNAIGQLKASAKRFRV